MIEYSDNYSKTSGSLWRYYTKPAVNDECNIVDFNAVVVTNSNIVLLKQTVLKQWYH